ncbi:MULTISPECIES: carboxymuconolactone decarboxylase family protein [Shewanella]|uniref:carboxymuconolactone decarboxylase family protein n=1 Tax=Shewanella TaxID=22 RepID=UPI001C66017A|nr:MULTISPECIES: carboxymuconolactone decarboxylase family protein [Shewanella]QYJ74491.1 carboxymuconolactone decarboxylase family protein [Shewanella sp. FJAT-52076]QYK04363.1 carboxymuconolactone decarboxylase family protein [Shewanella zhangzhouensis]
MAENTGIAQKIFGDFAPKLAYLTDDILFGPVWGGEELSQRDRSLITVAALITQHRPDQLRFHLAKAVENGLSQTELIEVITQLAFYAGWPSSMTALDVAREVFASTESAK